MDRECNEKIISKYNQTAIGFWTFLKTLRWLIIQHCAVLIGVYNWEHVSFRNIKEIFQSKVFIDYTYKMEVYLKNDMKMNTHSSMISLILPDIKYYVKENTRDMLKSDNFIKKVVIDMKQYFNEFSKSSIRQSINTSIVELCKRIGKLNRYH